MYIEKNKTCTNFRTQKTIRQRFGYLLVQILFKWKIKEQKYSWSWTGM